MGWAEQIGQRLQENNEDIAFAYEEITRLEKYVNQMKRGKYAAPISFSISGIGVGMMVNEFTKTPDTVNLGKAKIYVGVAVSSFGVWALGHWIFKWW
jgi:hypothetical protein